MQTTPLLTHHWLRNLSNNVDFWWILEDSNQSRKDANPTKDEPNKQGLLQRSVFRPHSTVCTQTKYYYQQDAETYW